MLDKYRGKIDCNEEELQDILSQYKDSKLPCPVDEKGWVYGNLINGRTPYIVGEVRESIPHGGTVLDYWYPVKKDTVGQFTGLYDKNGKEIYEGDILKDEFDRKFYVYWVSNEARFAIRQKNRKSEYFMVINHLKIKVIGNIYDNPELSEVRE